MSVVPMMVPDVSVSNESSYRSNSAISSASHSDLTGWNAQTEVN